MTQETEKLTTGGAPGPGRAGRAAGGALGGVGTIRPSLAKPSPSSSVTGPSPVAGPRAQARATWPEVIRAMIVGAPPDLTAKVQAWLRAATDPVIELAEAADVDSAQAALAAEPCDAVIVFENARAPASLEHVTALSVGGGRAVVCVGAADDPRRRRRELRRSGAAAYLERAEFDGDLLRHVLAMSVERAALQRGLDELRSRFVLALRSVQDGYWEWDIIDDAVFFSRRWREIMGYAAEDAHGAFEDWFSLVHADDRSLVRARLDAHVRGQEATFEVEHRVRAGDGTYRWVLTRGVVERDAQGTPLRMAGSLTDMTQFRARVDELRRQSRHDALTGLPRKELFMERLARAVEVAREFPDAGFVVLLVEVDRLRRFNESIGHSAGDHILSQIARRLTSCVDRDTLVARIGGAKFAVLVENVTDYDLGSRLADRFQEAMRSPFEVDEEPVYVSISVGITTSQRTYHRPEEVMSDATTAVTRAKQQPRGDRKRVFSTQMRMEAITQMRLEMALRQAVERQEFELHYQPIVSLQTGYLVGFEALIRWQSPERGRISPAEFIPIAEATGLIQPIGRWAFSEATHQLHAWGERSPAARHLAVSVNLSGRQVGDPQLLHSIARALNETEVEPTNIKIELTESVLMDNVEEMSSLLNALRELGVQIWVDDFGTGYSSLSYLHRFPVDGLKVDKTFVDGVAHDGPSQAMVQTIVNLSQQLEVELVAEGIETREQADLLRVMGCPSGQGYLFGRPCRGDEALALICSADTPGRP